MFIDLCHDDAQANWAEAYHQQLKHKNITREPVASGTAAISTVDGATLAEYKLTGQYLEMGVKWIIFAEP